MFQGFGGVLDLGRVQRELDGGRQGDAGGIAGAALGQGIEGVDGGDLAVHDFQPDGVGCAGGEQLDGVAAQGDGAGFVHALLRMVAAGGQVVHQGVRVQGFAEAQHGVGLQAGGRADALQDGGGGGQQQAGAGGWLGQGLQRAHALADDGGRRRRGVIRQHVPWRQHQHLDPGAHGLRQRGNAL